MIQFFYSHMQVIPAKGEEAAKIENLEGSFAMEMVLRSMKMGDGRMIVILKDGHEHTNTYKETAKSGKVQDVRVREWVQSEIVLIPKDALRYREACLLISNPIFAPDLQLDPQGVEDKESSPASEEVDQQVAVD